MTSGGRFIAGIGRLFLSFIFIVVGIATIFNWELAYNDLASALTNWQIYVGQTDGPGHFFDALMSTIPLLLIIGITLQIVGGLMVFFSFYPRIGAFLLLIYLCCTTVLYHYFWFLEGMAMARSLVLFLKNLSIIGGLVVVLGLGTGSSSRRRARSPGGEDDENL